MRKTLFAVMVVSFLLAAALLAKEQQHEAPAAVGPAAVEDGISIFFSPKGGCTEAVVEQIQGAKKSLDMQAYSFTSTEIAKALAAAHDRGVKIRAVLDKNAAGEKYSGATYLANHGIPTWVDGKHAIAHNKIMIIDGQTIITGSFNFTKAAEEHNAENLLIIQGKAKLVEAYTKNFEAHLGHSEVYQGVKDGR